MTMEETPPPVLGKSSSGGLTETEKLQLIKSVVNEVFSTYNMRVKSVLTTRQMVNLVRLEIYAKKYRSSMARLLVQALYEGPVSTDIKGGRGRKDLVETLKAIVSQGEPPENTKTRGMMQRLLMR